MIMDFYKKYLTLDWQIWIQLLFGLWSKLIIQLIWKCIIWQNSTTQKKRKKYVYFFQGDDSSLPVCSASCTVHLQLFTNIDILKARPESPYNKQICSTLSVCFLAYTISKGLAYITILYHYILVDLFKLWSKLTECC